MENLRLLLWVALVAFIWGSVITWRDHFKAPEPGSPAAIAASGTTDATLPALPDMPTPTAGTAQAGDAPALNAAADAAATEAPATRLVTVRTDVLDLAIDLQGGDVRSATLPRYPKHKDEPDVPVRLLSPSADDYFVFQTGLRAADGAEEANHLATFEAAAERFELADGASDLVVPLTWQGADGVTVEKIYRFRRGRYDVELEYRVVNARDVDYRVASYLQIKRLYRPLERSMFNVDSYSFYGPVLYDGQKYQKLEVDKLRSAPVTQAVDQGWLAAIEHHFLVAAVPPPGDVWNYDGRFYDGHFQLSAIGPVANVAPGDTATFTAQLFVGPKLQRQLAETAEGLPLTVDYGKLTLLAQPLFWLLEKVQSVVGNWGLTIIFVTFLIKLAFYKLSETSGRSMARMRTLAPRMKALQERYKEDRQALSQAMMDLYKREKVNPAAGCLPMLVQIPFFIAFYWVLLESVEMRQAPFLLWITDLSSRDPYFILPLLMGGAMWFQQSLNPPPPDPTQAKIMQFMPVVFTGFFAFFPAGLVLYWLTNSVLSIAQQWRINKVLGAN